MKVRLKCLPTRLLDVAEVILKIMWIREEHNDGPKCLSNQRAAEMHATPLAGTVRSYSVSETGCAGSGVGNSIYCHPINLKR